MSFIREVLNLVNENEVIDARTNIIKLIDEIRNFQYKVKSYIDENYVNFLPNLNNNKLFLDKGEHLSNEVELLMQNINNETKNDLLTVSKDLQKYLEELNEVALGLRTSFKILRIDDLFFKIEASKLQTEYQQVMEYICEMKNLIDDPNDRVLHRLDCFENLKIKYRIEHEMLLHTLRQRFESLVQMNEKSFQKNKSVTLKISKDENLLHEIIVALVNSKFNPRQMCDFLIDNVFTPTITKPVSLDFNESADDFVVLTLSFSLKPLADDLRPNYKIVLQNLEIVIKCLGYMNIEISNSVCVFSIFSDYIKEQFLNLLKHNCLVHSIPNTMDEMNDSTMVEDLLTFNAFLCDMLFLNETRDTELQEFANQIEILFKKRFCLNILDSAVVIMHKGLHDMVLISDSENSSDPNSPNTFPKCMISKSTLVS